MKYYTIQNDSILIAENEQALTRFYDNVFELPEDYKEGKYIIGEKEIEIEVPDYETVEEEYEVFVPSSLEGEGEAVNEDDSPNVTDSGEGYYETRTREVERQVGTHTESKTIKVLVLNPDYEQEQAERREAEFNKAFFKTSLGYIRRSVTMQDKSKKDFLSDLFPAIKAGLELGQEVYILTYDKPQFDEDVTDWTEYQHRVQATAQFVGECLQQVVRDFAG